MPFTQMPVSWVYRNPIYHEFVFGSMLLIQTGRCVWLTSYSKHSDRLGPQKRAEIKSLFLWGAAWFLSGFFIWNLDNLFCGTVTGWKKQLGWPAAFLLEGESSRFKSQYKCCELNCGAHHRPFVVAPAHGTSQRASYLPQ